MFSELTPAQMAEIERIPISKREEAEFGKVVVTNLETFVRSTGNTMTREGKDVKYLA